MLHWMKAEDKRDEGGRLQETCCNEWVSPAMPKGYNKVCGFDSGSEEEKELVSKEELQKWCLVAFSYGD